MFGTHAQVLIPGVRRTLARGPVHDDRLVLDSSGSAPLARMLPTMTIKVLVISGPAGVGKSTVAYELSRRFAEADVDHALIDSDELDRMYPEPPDLWALSERNVAAVWAGFAERGARRLILVGVYLDRPLLLDSVRRAIPNAEFAIVRLVASEQTLRERVYRREIGPGAGEQFERTRRQLAALASDVRPEVHLVGTDGWSPADLASSIMELAGWRGDG